MSHISTSGAYKRLAWSEHHLERVKEATHAYVREIGTIPLVHEIEPESGDHVVRVGPVAPIPSDLAHMVGDTVHNLRSILDNLVYSCAVDLPRSSASPERVAFPLCLFRRATAP